ncbi:hypothetical protein [Phaeobacter sp. HF9A]|uniref:hypothetical protein n=1 Tax=Phaeobacter sp. HF9A TaxID=2721561 RepID=UPI0014307C31|nr:hypothetical protein [Phaeobacter sp. HF9A]NIZ14704.1 hypothetical protein [Phaeobacter sp. HF9A]
MPSQVAKAAVGIVNQLEQVDLESPSDMRKQFASAPRIVVKLLSELAARRMLKPATPWPGQNR